MNEKEIRESLAKICIEIDRINAECGGTRQDLFPTAVPIYAAPPIEIQTYIGCTCGLKCASAYGIDSPAYADHTRYRVRLLPQQERAKAILAVKRVMECTLPKARQLVDNCAVIADFDNYGKYNADNKVNELLPALAEVEKYDKREEIKV